MPLQVRLATASYASSRLVLCAWLLRMVRHFTGAVKSEVTKLGLWLKHIMALAQVCHGHGSTCIWLSL